jgi:uncharacterized protein (TIGR03118 family)
MTRITRSALLGGLVLIASAPAMVRADSFYQQTNLVTSATDPDLINPWGISSSSGSPFWVSDNGTGKSTLYNTAGVKQGLIVSMPNSDPITGQVFNGTASFHGNVFLFASENGTIDGWRGALGTNAEQLATVAGAVYKGLAISTAKDMLFAANFHAGTIDVFNTANPAAPTGSFSDPTAPAGYAPFNIQNLGGKLYVTFAQQDATGHDDVGGVGHGLIDVFDPTTNTFTRLVTGSAAGGTVDALNSPWGVALAPTSFGQFGGDLLVGNFGDGLINAFDPVTGALLGHLSDENGNALVNPGLWGLIFGNGGSGGTLGTLYFAAGGADEASGVFGQISAVPEPSSLVLLGLGGALLYRIRRRAPGA